MYEQEIHATLKLIVEWRERRPVEDSAGDLEAEFTALARESSDAYEVEDRIWDMWTSHANVDAAQRMGSAIAAIASKQFDVAGAELDHLVQSQPNWAEAWNKRATLKFLQGRDRESLMDIKKTLELEPRHFGAMSGFAQICLRIGDPDSARIALEQALCINPSMQGIRLLLQGIQRDDTPSVH